MRMSFFILFFMVIIGLGSAFSFFVFNLYQVFRNPLVYKIALALFAGMPIIFIMTYALSAKGYSQVNALLNLAGTVWIGTLLYFFLASVVMAILYFFIKGSPTLLAGVGSLALVVIFLIVTYATYNASHPVVTTMTVKSPDLAPGWADKKIVLFSDTHLGLIRGERFTKKVAALVNTQNPDLVLMAGDMIDGPIIPYEKFSRPFADIHSTYGVYYTPGNHEWYNVEADKFIGTMEHLTKELIDEKLEVNGTQIIGINYGHDTQEQTKMRLRSTGFDPSIPSIAILHDPKNNDVLTQSGVSLVVSGHTHCGQIWPFSAIAKKIYRDKFYGVRQLGNQATITTCGIGTAQAPFRIGNKPEIVVIKIVE